jgi:hypothetical protein
MIFWILLGLWIFNIFASKVAHSIRVEWIGMQRWLIEQQNTLFEHLEFLTEAEETNKIALQINKWADQSIRFGAIILIAAQLLIAASLFTVVLYETVYIPMVVALFEATAIVYVWIMIQRYYKARGMCYAVLANVSAAQLYNENAENTDNGSESGSPNTGGDAGNSDVRRRQDD